MSNLSDQELAAQREREGHQFFVTCKKSTTSALALFLLGPYATHAEALSNVERGRGLAEKADHWAHVYAYGTASAAPGVIQSTVFGK